MSQPQPQPQTSAKFQLHSTLSSSLEDPPSPTHTSSTNNSQQSRNEKYHKSIKKSLNKMSFTTPNYSDSDIFERTCQGHGILNSKRTPSHYNLENYTSPILDTITNNPLNSVTLNCFCEGDEPMCCAERDDEQNINNAEDEDEDENRQQDYTGPQLDDSEHHQHHRQHQHEESFTPPFIRPRARSIISQSLISTLNHKNNSTSTTPHPHPHAHSIGSGSGSGNLRSSTSSTGVSSLSFHPLAKRLKSYAGQTPISKDKVDTNAIDFYSFADMNQMENDQESYATTTISAKDYIGRF